jgi:hypothetical protein
MDGKRQIIQRKFGEAEVLPGLNRDFLLRCIQPKDFLNRDIQASPCDANGLADRAELVLRFGFAGLNADRISIRGNIAHCVRSTPHIVTLRALNQTLRKATGVQPAHRDTIIRQLHTVLGEGVQHRVYKFDIKSFFESLDRADLFVTLGRTSGVPRSALLALKNYFDELSARNVTGLPRGVQLSATLSEFSLKQFDIELSSLPEIYFHSRYVDDILIVTGARENPREFTGKVRALLPPGLNLNHHKTKVVELPSFSRAGGVLAPGQFDYLGYCFSVHPVERDRARQDRFHRRVDVDLAKRKVQRIKSRVCLSVCQYLQDGSISDLERRLQLLTGNCNIRDFSTGKQRSIGLFSNYKRANSLAAFIELDSFLTSILAGNKNRLGVRLATSMNKKDRRSLLKYSFVESFQKRTFYNFSVTELALLKRCWQNV